MKKQLLLTLVLPAMLLTGCNQQPMGVPKPLPDSDTFTNTSIKYFAEEEFRGVNAKTKDYSFDFSYSNFVDSDNTAYSKSLASLGVMLSADAYVDSKCNFDGGKAATSLADYQTIYENLKCDDISVTVMNKSSFEKDKTDLANYILANHSFVYKGAKRQVFFITIEGTNGPDQWTSNFDIGYANDTYKELTGEHKEWSNTKDAKGFNIAANRVLNAVNAYVSDKKQEGAEPYYFITGHSRGAAVANILGHLINETSADMKKSTFVYTYACPNTTTELPEKPVDENIFNFVNETDLISAIPLKGWGFGTYGKTYRFNPNGNTEFATQWKGDHFDNEYEAADVASIESTFLTIAATREAVFTYETSTSEQFDSIEEANDILASMELTFPGISTYVKVVDFKEGVVTFKYVPFMITCVVQGLLNGVNPFMALYLAYINPTYFTTFAGLSSFLEGNSVIDGHLPTTYIAMMDYVQVA